MFRAIHDPDNHYLIHIDKKAPEAFHKDVGNFLVGYPNAKLMRSRNWVYGGYSAVQIQLEAMEELFPSEWDFFVNLTGQDFPLKTQADMKEFLRGHAGKNFLHIMDQRRDWARSLFRIKWHYVELRGKVPLPARRRVLPLPFRRRFIKGAIPYGGSTWFIMSRPFCEYVCRNREVEKYKTFYKHTFIPEEGFFQTVIMHSPFKDTLVPDNKRLICWPNGRIQVFRSQDYSTLTTSDAFFARKFDETVDSEIVDRMAARLETPPASVESVPASASITAETRPGAPALGRP
jgi:hypothetical protein